MQLSFHYTVPPSVTQIEEAREGEREKKERRILSSKSELANLRPPRGSSSSLPSHEGLDGTRRDPSGEERMLLSTMTVALLSKRRNRFDSRAHLHEERRVYADSAHTRCRGGGGAGEVVAVRYYVGIYICTQYRPLPKLRGEKGVRRGCAQCTR